MKKILIIGLIGAGLALAGCAAIGSAGSSPQALLTAAEVGLDAANALYTGFCTADASASWCTAANEQTADAAFTAISGAISGANAVISGNGTAAQVQAAVSAVESAITSFTTVVNDIERGGRASSALRAVAPDPNRAVIVLRNIQQQARLRAARPGGG